MKEEQGFFNEQWIMLAIGPFFHFPFFIGIAMPILKGIGKKKDQFVPSASYIAGWVCKVIAACLYYNGVFS
jgi:hypothetical protein